MAADRQPNEDGTVEQSPHVLSFTNQRRGMTPPTWNAVHEHAGVWDHVSDGSGPADFDGDVHGSFEDGPGGWQQT